MFDTQSYIKVLSLFIFLSLKSQAQMSLQMGFYKATTNQNKQTIVFLSEKDSLPYLTSGDFSVLKDQRLNPKSKLTLEYLGSNQNEALKSLQINPESIAITDYYSHRGSSYIPHTNTESEYPSNTIGAFKTALDEGFQGVEIDLQLTLDNEFIVNHDQKLSVSTNCKGFISQHKLNELKKCEVKYSPLIPELKLFRSRSPLKQKLSSLKDFLTEFIDDPRLKHLILDVKPAKTQSILEALDKSMSPLSEAQKSKIILLFRENLIKEVVKNETQKSELASYQLAPEGEKGWELYEETPHAPSYMDQKYSSLGIGLGLGFSGLKSSNQKDQTSAIFQVSQSVFKLLGSLVLSDFQIPQMSSVSWSKNNIQKVNTLINIFRSKGIQVIAWTVSTPHKIKKQRRLMPMLPFVLTDLPHTKIAKIQAQELSQFLTQGKH